MAVAAQGVDVAVGPVALVPTNETMLRAGSVYVNVLPDTETAGCATRFVEASVRHGVTDVTLTPFNAKVWLVAEVLLLIAMKTIFDGDDVFVFLNALT